jgi:hypothetical protein
MSPFGLSPKASAGLMGVVLIQGRSLTERTVGERGSRKEAGRVKLNELMLERGKPKRRRHSIRAPDAKQSKATGARSERRGKRTGRISRRGGANRSSHRKRRGVLEACAGWTEAWRGGGRDRSKEARGQTGSRAEGPQRGSDEPCSTSS